MAVETSRSRVEQAAQLIAQARAQRGLIEARCRCLNVMFEYRPVPDFYVLEKCRKCGYWNTITTETPG